MSFNSEYQELRKKRKKNEQENKASNDVAPLVFSMSDIAPVSARNINNIDTDIAPVAKTEKVYEMINKSITEDEEDDTWFKKGALKDGYQFGDVTGSLLSTVGDAAVGLGKGALTAAEGVSDFILHGVGYGADAVGLDGAANALHESANINTANFILSPVENYFEKNSFFGDKVDKVTDVVGNFVGQVGLATATGGYSLLATGVSAAGSATTEAYQGGATDGEALAYGIDKGVIEAGTEALFGGLGKFVNALGFSRGIGGLDDILAKKIAGKITNFAVRNAVEFGVKATGEGIEEVLAGLGSAVAKKMTYMSDEELGQLVKDENLLDSFLIGTALSGASQIGIVPGTKKGGLIEANQTGTDFVTGLTTNEEAVVNKEVENRIAEREAKGEKVTNKVKNEIYKEVMEDLPKGYISTDTIESVLDGEGYESYKNLRDKESSLNERISSLDKEINTLLDKENPTIRDNERLAEARKELETAKSDLEKIGGHINEHITYTRHNMNEVLRGERRGKGSYLSESYNEIGRLSERYVADFSKYEGAKHADAARHTIENAMKRGANNTNRVHDIVDLGASLSADTGIVFDWAGDEDIKNGFIEQQKKEIAKLEALTELSEEQTKTLTDLKEMLRKVEAGEVKVNGNITDDSIVINLDSKKALESIVGHEIAHSLENTKAYQALKETLFAYAKKKGVNIEAEIEAKTKTYKGVKKAKPEAELVADLVGDYIFNDYNFVLDLAMNNKNTFQKLWDDVKYLCKIATTGSKEARDLARAKRNFERAYRESLEVTKKTDGVTKNSLVIEYTNGKTEELADARNVTDAEAIRYLKMARSGELNRFTYVPVMSNTPKVILDTVRQVQKDVEDRSMIMQVKKARQSMREDMSKKTHTGANVRGHALAPENILEIIHNLDNPQTVIYQTERHDENGNPLPDNFAIVVTYADGETEGIAVVEFDSQIDKRFIREDYGETKFHTVVTVLEPDTVRDGMPYDYVEELLKNPNNYELEIIKEDISNEAATSGTPTTASNDMSSERIIPQNSEKSSGFSKFSLSDSDGKQLTSDPDIRFSLSEAVEETKDLMALHNLKSAELLKSFELGGLPMPSIAIIKAEAGHDQYGEISLILPKESIDPQASRDNKVYGGDAWTPTYPRMQYKANEAVAKRLRDKYYAMESEYGYDKVRSLYNYVYELENALNRSGGEAALKEELYDDTRMMQVYLLDSGKGEVPTVKKEIRTELTDHEVSMYEFFAQRLGDQVIDGVNQAGLGSPIEQRKAYWENHGKAIKEAYGEFLSKEFGFSEEDIQNVLSNMKTADFLKVVRDAKKYQTNGRVTTKTEDDFNATQEAIREAAGEGYRAWVDDLFGGSEEKSGIRNNVDYYTRNGNPRSWEALHWENTLENVVKAMKQQDNTGSEALFGVHKFFAASSKNYKNIAEIKADSDRLHKISDGDYKAAKDSYESRFVDVANRIMDKTESNRFIAQENAMECIVDAVRNSRTHDGIYRELSQYGQLDVTEQDVADIVSLVNDIANMPTGYFEAKPMRAVGFDEVGVFVIPRNADVKLKQELLNRGYAIAEYDPDVEGDRQKVVNSFEKYKFSLSDEGEQLAPLGRRGTYGKDFRVQGDNVLAPVQEGVANNATTTETAARADLPISDIDYAPIVDEMARLEARVASLQAEMDSLAAEAHSLGDQLHRDEITVEEHEARVFGEIKPRYNELADERLGVEKQLKALDETEAAEQGERIDSLTDADAPSEIAPYYGDNEAVTPEDPFYNRDIKEVGNRKVKAYMYENPEVKPFFQKAAEWLLSDLRNTTRGERFYTEVDWSSKGVWSGVQRQTSPDIAYLLDNLHYTYQQIEDGLNAIIEDNGKENNACSKKIEFLLNDRLLKGFEDIDGREIPPDQDYINLLNEKQIKEYNEEARQKFFEAADEYAPFEESAEPTIEAPFVPTEAEAVTQPSEDIAPLPDVLNAGRNVAQGRRSMFTENQEKQRVAQVLTEEPQAPKKKSRALSKIRTNFLDKQSVFEDLALKTKNRELMGKANYMLSSESRAQWFIGHGNNRVKALTDIREEVESSGKLGQFYDYMYHVHNIDRMSLETDENRAKRMAVRQQFQGFSDKQIQSIALTWIAKDTTAEEEARIRAAREYVELSKNKNKPVFGYSETADVSREKVKKFEAENPEFKAWAQDVYDYNKYLRKMLVDGNVISQETADLWEKIYPHFVPIRREGHDGAAVNVPLDSRKTGVNAPIKRATGGNADILPLFDTMALRTEQTFKAVAKNQFGLELMHTLDSAIEADEANGSAASVDDILESMEAQDELLQKGKDGMNPTFTVFENGKRVTFEITEDIYDALKPTSEGMMYTNKALNTASNIRRGLITEYNPVFLATNAIKDAQDVFINSQHPAKTYANLPKAYWELAKKGKWYTEYMAAGGEQNTFFDGDSKTFKKEDEGFKKLIGIPLRAISAANNFIERAPRLAEYIASRESGASIETAMLDAARVTTNFAAGGDVTKLLNRNGFTFLNASVQGFNQQVRNVREAKANGFKGWAKLAAKTMIAGIPALLLNGLLWDDDEDYEELSDYVKDNYYIVAKYGDGQFVRIPKGRAVAVIQDAFEQIKNVATGEEADWKNLWELAKTNIAPTNPADNHIFAPIQQVLQNETWYGEDLVPTRLQDLPANEQFDESTDSLSKWLGEVTNTSPIKLNYLLDQYSGAVGDVFLPMMTPEAESGNDSLAGNMIAPWKDKFTTDSVMNNQNVSDFYDKVDELTVNANGSRATDEDILMSKYMNSVSSEIGKLYGLKREVQNSDLPDSRKYEKVRDIQDEINSLARESLDSYANVWIDGNYAEVGDRRYKLNSKGSWEKVSDDDYNKQEDVTEALGISASDYWSDKSEHDFAYKYPEKYVVAKSVGGYDSYKSYMSDLYEIKADKDENGKSITGSRKEKVIAWLNEQEDLDYGEAIILFKSEYKADDTYNMDIIDYLNGRDDISFDEMSTILKELCFNVDSKGNITWD